MDVGTLTSAEGRDQFLQLLVTQMRNQNPLDPMSDSDFVAQLAQFSMLEGVEKLNGTFEQMLMVQQLTGGVELIGKTVIYQNAAGTEMRRGIVSGIRFDHGETLVLVGTDEVPIGNVRGITE